MAKLSELLVTVAATTIFFFLTTWFFCRTVKQQPQKPINRCLSLRVDDIPLDERDDLGRNLRAMIERHPRLRQSTTNLVLHAITKMGKHFMCAIVSIETSLDLDDLLHWMRDVGNDYQYKYTSIFDGITPLHEDEDGAEVDIIAVPGLGSHALGSWKSTKNHHIWIRDFLPQDVPKIRVLLYGYDTKLLESTSKQSIEDLGSALLEQIIAFRANDGTSHYPIVFIGHSLGGLLIKEALIRASRRPRDPNYDLYKATFGLLFFGVPNLGFRNEKLMTIVQGKPNEALINDLLVDNDSEPSSCLKRLADQFSHICKDKYQVVTFFERKLSPTLKMDDRGRLHKTGPLTLLVTEKSTTSMGLVAMADEDNVALNTDHSGLVKYDSRNQSDYAIVRERLKRLVNGAREKVPARFRDKDKTQACMRSLAFQDMDGRQSQVKGTSSGTCEWLFHDKTFMAWRDNPRGLLWIEGKPGSGKSVLLKYILGRYGNLYGPKTLLLSFFFHGRGHELQKSQLGLLRCILHQLLEHAPETLSDLISHFETKSKTEGKPGHYWQWHLHPLFDFLRSSLQKTLKEYPIVIIIDALDECGEEQAIDLIASLENLISGLSSTGFHCNIIFSCRRYPILQLVPGFTICLDTKNGRDIETYIQARFSKAPDPPIEQLISGRAGGIFMWADLVVDRVFQMRRQGIKREKIIEQVNIIPKKLSELYVDLITRVEDSQIDDHLNTLKLLLWVSFSLRPLTTDELQWAMVVDRDCTARSIVEYQSSCDFVESSDIDKRITTLSHGLAEIVQYRSSRVVQFIHQSVKDFLLDGGFTRLNRTGLKGDISCSAHSRLSRVCLEYFKAVIQSCGKSFSKKDQSRFPFVGYAIESWVLHMKLGDLADEPLRSFLQLLEWPDESLVGLWAHAYKSIESQDTDWLSQNTRLVHIAAGYGIGEVLLYLSKHHEPEFTKIVDLNDDMSSTPLLLAAQRGHEAVVEMLLKTQKVKVNSTDKDYWTPLLWAVANNQEAVVKILLSMNNINVNSKDRHGQTPLLVAVKRRLERLVQILLEADKIEVDTKDKDGRTALSWAAERRLDTIIAMLIDKGKADVNLGDRDGRTPLFWAAGGGRRISGGLPTCL